LLGGLAPISQLLVEQDSIAWPRAGSRFGFPSIRAAHADPAEAPRYEKGLS